MWLKSYFKGKGRGTKLQPKYIGPYTITKCLPHQVYEMVRNGRISIQHEGRIRAYTAPEVERTQPARTDKRPAPVDPPPVPEAEAQSTSDVDVYTPSIQT